MHAIPGRFLVRFRSETDLTKLAEVLAAKGVKLQSVRSLGRFGGALAGAVGGSGGLPLTQSLAVVRLAEPAASVVAQLRREPNVLYVEPDSWLQLHQEAPRRLVPDDFEFGRLWNLDNQGQVSGSRPDADIDAPEAWHSTTGDPRLRIAVIDTGIDYFHPDLEANLWANPGEVPGNGLDDDHNGFVDDVCGYDFVSDDGDPMDDHGHGTHVAGTIAAVGNNGLGVVGVCWRAQLMALKAFDESGSGAVSDVIAALDYAVRNGARVVNASWGQKDKSLALQEAMAQAHAAGLILVASAGNDRTDAPAYPAAYPTVVAVAATDAKDQRAVFSNSGSHVAVAAPGNNIYSTLPNGTYDFLSGTSMSAPHVSGTAALVLARHPELTGPQVESILRNTADPITADRYIGLGRLNAWRAVTVEHPLPTARLALPSVLSGRVSFRGTAEGDRFAGYRLECGRGVYPTNWTLLQRGSTPVHDGTLLADYSTAALAEGDYVIRLTAEDTEGLTATDRGAVTVRNVVIASPQHNDLLRAGEPVSLRGTVFGPGRTYVIDYGVGWQPSHWFSGGMTLTDGGNHEVVEAELGVWETRNLRADEFYTLRLTAFAGAQKAAEWRTHLVYLDSRLKPGWPQYIPVEGSYVTNDWRGVTVADLDADGFEEILRVDSGNSDGKPARLLVYDYQGRVKWSQTLGRGEPYADVPVAGDVDGDGYLEVFTDAGEPRQLYAFHHDGTPLGGRWPAPLEAADLGKVLADIDRDGRLEIIGYAQLPVVRGSSRWRQLVVYDADGVLRRRWDLANCEEVADVPKMFPAVGNLDSDPELEIVAVNGCNEMAVFDWRKPADPVWRTASSGWMFSSPVVGDLNHDQANEIVIAVADPKTTSRGGTRGGLEAWTCTGRRLPGWPVLIEESFLATPALADLDGDGNLEIVLPNWSLQKLHAVRPSGFELEGWPVTWFDSTSAKSMATVGDVDSDGSPDVVMVTAGLLLNTALSGDFSTVGGVRAWASEGSAIPMHRPGELPVLIMEGAGGSSRFKGWPVTLTDLDHNGRLDIVAVSVEDRGYSPTPPEVTRKNRYSLYAWELPVPCVRSNLVWPMFQRDAQRTGYFEPVPRTNRPPVVADIPDQTVRVGSPFFRLPLDSYVEDPDHAATELTWTVEGNQWLRVEIDPNRVLTVTPLSPDWIGQEELRFVARDSLGATGSATATFAVKSEYEPPVANPDAAVTLEDEPVTLAVLGNDRDPHGLPLRVLQVSKPGFGKVQLIDPDRILYQPAPNFNGRDSFTYLLNNGQDGMAIGAVTVEVLPVQDPPVAQPDWYITLEDTPVELEPLANDEEVDGDPLFLVDTGNPAHGTLTPLGAGRFLYTPQPDYSGLDTLTYRVTDQATPPVEGVVTIMVKPVNDAPVTEDQAFTLNRNSQRDVIYAARDADGDELTFKIIKAPEHGELWTYPKLATYYPARGFVGTDSFTYQASDGEFSSPVTTVVFTVVDANNPPVAEPLSLVTRLDHGLTFKLKATDADLDPLTFQIVRRPPYGSLFASGSNCLYIPDAGFVGEESFSFVANDGQANSAETPVSLRVTDTNTAPVAQEATLTVWMNAATNLVLQATDGESDPLVFLIQDAPVHGELSGQPPDCVYAPNRDYLGPDRVTFKVSDGALESEVASVLIAVVFPNTPPVTTNQVVSVVADTSCPLRLTVSDADGDPLRCAVLKGPEAGRVYGMGTNFIYVPKPGFVGLDSFTYKAWDGHAYSQVSRVYLRVALPPVEVPPAFESIQRLGNGQLRLTLRATSGRELRIQASANLLQWGAVAVVTPGTNSVSVDLEAPAQGCRFYRALQ